jgi:TonB family protein
MFTNQLFSAAMRHRRNLFLPLALATTLSACQKAETVPTTAERLKYVEQKQQTQPDFYVPRKVVDYMSDLKSLKDAPAPKVAPPPEPPAAKAADIKQTVAETKPAAPVVATPAPAPAPVQPAPTPVAPPANVVASAAPTARPVPPKENPAAVIVVTREQPDFPREAARSGIESGSVKARVMINAAGTVSSVVILEARPSRVFDRSVTQALQRWKFNPGAEGRTYDTEINFKL